MVYKKFILHVIVRIILIVAGLSAFAWYTMVSRDMIKAVFLFILLVLLVFELIRYVNKSNRDFRDFINLILNDDFSTRFSSRGKGRSFENLYKDMNALSEKYQRMSIDRELKQQHLLTVLEHIDIGIISFDHSGQIQFVNRAFQDLFKLPFLAEHQGMEKLNPEFRDAVNSLKTGTSKLLRLKIEEQEVHLSLLATEYKLKEEEYKLITVKNIMSELEQQELESYQKLIRVLTHEIMNSITPISSLSSTLDGLLKSHDLEGNQELMEQVKTGIAAIHDRSSNLLGFTKSYRKLTRLPQPEISPISLDEMVMNTQSIVFSFPNAGHMKFENDFAAGITFDADPKMIEQVLINIYKNAIEALQNTSHPLILTSIQFTPNHRLQLIIKDNGPGMNPENLEKMFIPFYTTKKEGSGIGMSLCRQIILAHHGHIKAESVEGEGCRITIIV